MRVQHLHMNKDIPLVSCDSNLLTSLHCFLKCLQWIFAEYTQLWDQNALCYGVRSQAFCDIVSIALSFTLRLVNRASLCEHFQQRDDPCRVGFYAFNSLSLLSSDSISELYIQLLSGFQMQLASFDMYRYNICHHAQIGQNVVSRRVARPYQEGSGPMLNMPTPHR